MSQEPLQPDLEDAFAYVANVLSEKERHAFEQALDQSKELRDQVAQLQRLSEDLLTSAPAITPASELKQRVMAAVDQPGPSLVRAGPDGWIPAGPEGVEIRTLRKDLETRREMLLLRMHPGSDYPLHSHPGAEDCYVISGDLQDGALNLRSGDFIRFPTDTEHGPITSQNGCVLLLEIALTDSSLPA